MALDNLMYPNCEVELFTSVITDNKRWPSAVLWQNLPAFIYDVETDQFAYDDSEWWQEIKRLIIMNEFSGVVTSLDFKVWDTVRVFLNWSDLDPVDYVVKKWNLKVSWLTLGGRDCTNHWQLVLAHDYYDNGWL